MMNAENNYNYLSVLNRTGWFIHILVVFKLDMSVYSIQFRISFYYYWCYYS